MTAAGDRPRIVVGTNNYPSLHQPNWGTFVENLVRQWTRTGSEVAVIAPHFYWSPTSKHLVLRHPETSGEGEPTVLRPGFMTWSNLRLTPSYSTMRWTIASFRRAMLGAARRLPFAPDLAYAHFLFPGGYGITELARRLGIPAVVALGESGFELYERNLGADLIGRTLRSFDAVLSVSDHNRDYCVEHFGLDPARTIVVPNATDTERFRPRNRAALRRELGLPVDRPVLAFSGRFAERKGPMRIMQAIRELPEVCGIFLGDGPDAPTGEQVLVARKVPHDEVAKYLGAADLFVLPTLREGSPNSVVEALASGLPVVSSDLPSLRETVTPECAILVDPLDGAALREAIRAIAFDPERRRAMSEAARTHALRSSLGARAERIRAWLAEVAAAGRRDAERAA